MERKIHLQNSQEHDFRGAFDETQNCVSEAKHIYQEVTKHTNRVIRR